MQFATDAKKNKRRHLRQVREDANLPFGADNLKLDMVQFQIISLCCGRKNMKTAMRFFIALKMHYESYPQVKSVTVITQKNSDLWGLTDCTPGCQGRRRQPPPLASPRSAVIL